MRPSYLSRGKNYEPYSYTLSTVAPVYDYDNANIIQERKENYFNDYKVSDFALALFVHTVEYQNLTKAEADIMLNKFFL